MARCRVHCPGRGDVAATVVTVIAAAVAVAAVAWFVITNAVLLGVGAAAGAAGMWAAGRYILRHWTVVVFRMPARQRGLPAPPPARWRAWPARPHVLTSPVVPPPSAALSAPPRQIENRHVIPGMTLRDEVPLYRRRVSRTPLDSGDTTR
jgi:hypothetical protein